MYFQYKQKGFAPILILVGILMLLGAAGGAYYLGRQTSLSSHQQNLIITSDSYSQASPSASVSPSPADETASWKIYTSQRLSFKYPAIYTVKENDPNFFVLLSNPANPQSVEISIDARLSNSYVDYAQAVVSTKQGLTDAKTEDISDGVKISGKVGPGYGEGMNTIIALFKYNKGAIESEITTSNSEKIKMFDQVISSFKFTDQK